MVQKIYSKEVEHWEYSITHFPGDNAYAVYLRDRRIQEVQIIPELGTFGSEKEAKRFIEKHITTRRGRAEV